MKRSMHYDKEGNPISFARWGELLSDRKYSVIEQTEVCGFFVSTVWIGTNTTVDGPPMIFETQISKDDKRTATGYATEAEARAAHAQIVNLLKERAGN